MMKFLEMIVPSKRWIFYNYLLKLRIYYAEDSEMKETIIRKLNFVWKQ